jgi:hypothetical protein
MSTTPGTDLQAPFDPSEFKNFGMEDVEAGDLVIPRLSIMHKEGRFINNLSKEEIERLQCVILGLVKQRIMWDEDVDEGDRPQCKSSDHDHGYPQLREDIPMAKQFPWDESNFNKADFLQQDGSVVLPCDSCVFNSWSKDTRTGKSIPPRCSEQHTYPVIYTTDEGETTTTAILTFQRTGIKPSKNYLSTFSQAGMPMFTSFTELTLQVTKRGNVEYSVPVFRKGNQTDRSDWRHYADTYMQIREFLRTPPRRSEDEEAPAVQSDNTNTAPIETQEPPTAPVASTPPPQASATASAPVAAPVDNDDPLPF